MPTTSIRPYESQAYWRDVGTIDSYFDAHQDVLGREPRFDAFNPQWPIYSSSYQGPVARVVEGEIHESILAGGVILNGGRVSKSVLRREVMIEPEVELDECILMDYVHVRRGAKLRRVIVDRYNVIEPGTRIGFDRAADAARYHVSPGGVVVIPRGKRARALRGGFDEAF